MAFDIAKVPGFTQGWVIKDYNEPIKSLGALQAPNCLSMPNFSLA